MAHTNEQILGLLADGSSWTGAALADRLGVSLRTTRRALARLKADGFALDAEPGRGGGVRLARSAGLPRVRLSEQEVVELLLALAVAESVKLPVLGTALAPLRSKLAAAFPVAQRASVGELRRRILFGAPASPPVAASWQAPGRVATRQLQEAFVARKLVHFDYRDEQGRRSRRVAETQYLLLNHPAWYLLGFDLDRQAGRVYRLDRMARIEAAAEGFQSRPAASLMTSVDRWFTPL